MGRRSAVIGQTGTVVLADYVKHKQGAKKTVRYRYTRLSDKRWMAWVCGPFFSRTYGACAWGARKKDAKERLKRHLARSYNYFGHLMFSDVDTGDTVGEIDARLLDFGAQPIMLRQE